MNLSLSRRRVLALLALTSILLITLDLRGNATIDAAKRSFSTIRSPMEDVGRAISRPVKNAWRGITHYGELERENDRLRQQIEQQQGEAIAAQVALRDYQELLAANQLSSLSQYSKVTAQVLAYAAQNFQQTVEINQGSKRGIRVGMPVVNAAGLVGKITSVTPDSAVVLLISDRNYSVTVKVVGDQPIPGTTEEAAAASSLPTDAAAETTVETTTTVAATVETTTMLAGETTVSSVAPGESTTTTAPATTTTVDISNLQRRELGGLEGQGIDGPPIVRFLNNDRFTRAIQVGDLVATNGGTTSLAPADLVVGRVSRVIGRAGAGGPTVEVEPAADLRQLNFVRVVLYIPPIEAASTG
ncbi:MAG: rod shape-determining protein MreC [Acidimicrobiia bacterium]